MSATNLQARTGVVDVMGLAVATAGWELRRLVSSWTNIGLALCALGLSGGLVLFKHTWFVPVEAASGRALPMTVLGSTGLGTLYEVTTSLAFFGMVVIFIAADGVAHDHRHRVHEILMASPIGSFAYVLGRFAAVLAVCAGLSVLVALSIVSANQMIHGSQPDYPPSNLSALATDWAVIVLPSVAAITGLSFMAATLKPTLATAIKLGSVLAWFALSVVVDVGHGFAWLGYWLPGGMGELKVVPNAVAAQYAALVGAGLPTAQLEMQAQQAVPNLWPWVGPHIGMTVIAIGLALFAAWRFKRYRDAL
jgi:ABC-type Na+ efflux pump permease subunit